jgi:hypothetical protein
VGRRVDADADDALRVAVVAKRAFTRSRSSGVLKTRARADAKTGR